MDASGCSLSQFDDDGDGIPDYLDQCPNTPGDEAADRNGCSPSQKDDDDDGVNNKIDICLLYTSPSPRDLSTSRMPSSA